MACLGNKQRSFCYFWDCTQVLHFGLFCWPWWLLHFFWGIPALSSRYNGNLSYICPFRSILVDWFLKCQCSLLPSPVWPLPICLDSWTWHYRFLCNIALTASDLLSPVTCITGYCFCFGSIPSFFLELFLHWSPVAYWVPMASSSSVSYHFAFPTVHGVLKARILKWFAILFSSGPHSVRPLHYDPPVLGGPTWHGLISLS